MKLRYVIGATVLAILGFGVFRYVGQPVEPQIDTSNQAAVSESEIVLPPTGKGVYANYDQSLLESTEFKHKVLFFRAKWSAIGNSVSSNLKASSIPDDVLILDVDYDLEASKSLISTYQPLSEHSFVSLDANQQVVKKWGASANDGLRQVLAQIGQ